MDCQRAIDSCNIESYNDNKLDSEKLDCHALQSKARNDDKIDFNLIQNLDSRDILNPNSKKSNFILESATSVIESFSNKAKQSIEKI